MDQFKEVKKSCPDPERGLWQDLCEFCRRCPFLVPGPDPLGPALGRDRPAAVAGVGMSTENTHCYVGTLSCGCHVAATIDAMDHPKVTAKWVASFIRDGYAVSRHPIEDICRRATKKGVGHVST